MYLYFCKFFVYKNNVHFVLPEKTAIKYILNIETVLKPTQVSKYSILRRFETIILKELGKLTL